MNRYKLHIPIIRFPQIARGQIWKHKNVRAWLEPKFIQVNVMSKKEEWVCFTVGEKAEGFHPYTPDNIYEEYTLLRRRVPA